MTKLSQEIFAHILVFGASVVLSRASRLEVLTVTSGREESYPLGQPGAAGNREREWVNGQQLLSVDKGGCTEKAQVLIILWGDLV